MTFFLGFRVKMQPQTTSAIIAVTKIPSCSCCIVVFSLRIAVYLQLPYCSALRLNFARI